MRFSREKGGDLGQVVEFDVCAADDTHARASAWHKRSKVAASTRVRPGSRRQQWFIFCRSLPVRAGTAHAASVIALLVWMLRLVTLLEY